MDITAIKISLIILYLLMCLIYALEKRWNEAGAQEICFTLLLCLFIPVLGFIFLKVADYVSKRNVSRDYSGIYRGERFRQDELSMLKPLDYETEVNQVPMKDALKLNEYEYRRKVIMNTLKEENTQDYIQVLKEALENEDPETSHYASTVIMQLRQKIQEAVILREKLYEDHPDVPEYAYDLEEELYRVIDSDVYEKENIRKYYLLYEKVSNQLLQQEHPKEICFFHRLHVNFRQGNFTQMKELSIHYLKLYPSSEDAVLSMIELCILTKDGALLGKLMDALPQIPARLTQKTMQYIRFFKTERNTE